MTANSAGRKPGMGPGTKMHCPLRPTLFSLKRSYHCLKPVHAAPHVGASNRQPHAHARGNWPEPLRRMPRGGRRRRRGVLRDGTCHRARLKCFRKSAKRFSEKKHDKPRRVLPEKCEAVFRKEARQTKELGCWSDSKKNGNTLSRRHHRAARFPQALCVRLRHGDDQLRRTDLAALALREHQGGARALPRGGAEGGAGDRAEVAAI